MTPDTYTISEQMLDVGDGHTLYVHEWGNKSAQTIILYLHGGPGNGCDDADKLKFDPTTQRVIFHDQRGCGKSQPTGLLEHNTASDLVADIEKISEKLQFNNFVLVGGSWGSTLALLYGIAHPEHVRGMVIDGVFMATQSEIDWLDKGGWRNHFPDIWEQYQASVPGEYRNNPSSYHFEAAFGDDLAAAKKSAYAYLSMELALLKLDQMYLPEPYDTFDPSGGRIEMYYLKNHCFIDDNEILQNASKLTMPVWIIQGRYDMVCPPIAAYQLDQALPNSHLTWAIGGHLKQHAAKTLLATILQAGFGDN